MRAAGSSIKKFATTTEEIRRILRLVANFTGAGENNRGGNQSNFLTRDSQDSRIFERFYEDSKDSEDSGEIPEILKRFQSFQRFC